MHRRSQHRRLQWQLGSHSASDTISSRTLRGPSAALAGRLIDTLLAPHKQTTASSPCSMRAQVTHLYDLLQWVQMAGLCHTCGRVYLQMKGLRTETLTGAYRG